MHIYFWLLPLVVAVIAAVYLIVRQLRKKPQTSLEIASQIGALEALIKAKQSSSVLITPEAELERLRKDLKHLRHRYEVIREGEIHQGLVEIKQDIDQAKSSSAGPGLAGKLSHFEAKERQLLDELQGLRRHGHTA